jgi:hypothetical protein
MIKKLAIATVLVSAVFALAQQRGKITSTQLDNGTVIILNMTDSTWQYEKTQVHDMDEDGEYIELTGGKIMWIKYDGTWTYVKVKPRAKANKMKEYPSLNVAATATHPTLDGAMKTANNDVYAKGAANLRKYLPSGIKDAEKILQACLRDRVKGNSYDEQYKQLQNKQWQVNTKITLHPYQVQEVMNCFEEQMDIAAAEAAKAAETKAAPATPAKK